MDGERIEREASALAFPRYPGTEGDIRAIELVAGWLREAGLEVSCEEFTYDIGPAFQGPALDASGGRPAGGRRRNPGPTTTADRRLVSGFGAAWPGGRSLSGRPGWRGSIPERARPAPPMSSVVQVHGSRVCR